MSEMIRVQVDCRGRNARVEVLGDGPDVLFVGTAAPMMWSRPGARALAANGYTVTNFDYGSHSADPQPRSALDQVADVVDVMDAVGIDRAVVVGLSRGAMTAFGLTAHHADRVSDLILAFPVAGFADTIGLHRPDPQPEPGEDEEAFMRRFLGTVFSEGFLASNLDDAIALATASPGDVVRVERSDEDPLPDGMAVDCATLIIEGGADEVVSSLHPARYLEAIPQAEHVVIPDGSHGWLMEQPERFAGIVAGFLSPDRGEARQSG